VTASGGLEDGTMSSDGTVSSDGGVARDGGGSLPEGTQAREAVAVAALSTVAVAVAVAAATPHADALAGANAGAVTLVGLLGVAAVTPALVRIDIAERRLPNVLVGVAAGAWGVSTALRVAGGDPAQAVTSVALALAATVLGLLAALAGGLGMGDVKLGAVLTGLLSTGDLTALLGFWGLAGTLAIGVAGARTFGTRPRRSRSRPVVVSAAPGRGVPFGPCLLAAFWCVVASRWAAAGIDAVVTVL
jgi:leader peptidase (prepilin peptidase)/N-methyltransferase